VIIARALALVGNAWGMACALYIAQFRFRSDQPSEPLSGGLANTAFAAAYVGPFVVALLAQALPPAYRAAAWFAVALLALALSVSAFSGVTLLIVPAVPVLLLAALITALAGPSGAARPTDARRSSRLPVWGAPLVAAGVVALGVAAWSLPVLGEESRCGPLIRSADGRTTWQPTQPGPAVQRLPGGGGQASAGGSVTIDAANRGQVGFSCGGWTPPYKSVLSLALWIVPVAALLAVRRAVG
jgi:hypothetical protein